MLVNLRKTFITAYDVHHHQPLSTDNIRYQGFLLCHLPARESFPYLGPGSQRCVGRKAGEAESVRQESEAQGEVRDPWSKAGSCEELDATFPARIHGQ
jgi:hypothetical protein